jgi:replicative DNA helicase
MSKEQLTSQIEATQLSWKRFTENRNKEWGLHGHDMGIHTLNIMLGGWIPSKLTTIGARSGIGKTALSVPMFYAGSRILNGRRAEFLFFSWEMESSYLVDRHICMSTGLTLKMLNQGAKLLGPQSLEKIKSAYSEAKRLPVTYQQHSTDINTVRKIAYSFIEDCKKKSELEECFVQPVIVVDYIGMAQFEGSGLRTYGIADFMNGMKQLANETGAAILILAQINRGADEKGTPERSDFSDSQSIEMASDNLVLLHRPEYNNVPVIYNPSTGEEENSSGKMLVRVLKGRDYGTGDSIMNCDIKHFRFWDTNHEFDTKYWELYQSREFWLDHFKLGSIATPTQLKVV